MHAKHSKFVAVKSLSLSIPDDVWQNARIQAAKNHTSVRTLVRQYLQAMAQGKAPIYGQIAAEDDERRSREQLASALQSSGLVLGFPPSRMASYER